MDTRDMDAASALHNAIRAGGGWDSFPTPDKWKRNGTARAWFAAHAGEVNTIQATVSESGELRNAWAPGWRVAVPHTSGVSMSGSLREYAGMRVVHADESHLVAVATWGDDRQAMLYMAR